MYLLYRNHRYGHISNADQQTAATGLTMEVTVGDVTVVITDYQPPVKSHPPNKQKKQEQNEENKRISTDSQNNSRDSSSLHDSSSTSTSINTSAEIPRGHE